jgi:uncharacterized protein YkuJ
MSEGVTAESIREIKRLVEAAQRAKFEHRPGDPDHIMHTLRPGMEPEMHTVEPPVLHVKLLNPESLHQFVVDQDQPFDPEIYVDAAQVTLVINRKTRRDRVYCPLEMSTPFAWLKNASDKPLSQSQLIRLLRITFAGCLPPESALLSIIRNLKFTAGSEANANIQHSKESLGKQIAAAVHGTSDVPDETVLTVRIFNNFHVGGDVHCAIEVFPAEQQFKITPYPREIERVLDEALHRVADLFEAMPVYFGAP